MSGFRFLNAVVVVSFSEATEGDLATAINDWIQANAGSRSLVQLDFVKNPSLAVFSAFLVYTE